MVKPFIRFLALLCTATMFSACATVTQTSSERISGSESADLRPAGVGQVLELLEQSRLKEAGKAINALLAKSPEDARLHLLNAVIYYELFLDGDRVSAEQAETGFMLARKFDSGLRQTSYYLGLLHLEQRRFDQARIELLNAVTAYAGDPVVLAALSHAAYYAKDLPLAIWAVEKWLAAKPEEHAAHASAAVIYAAAGDEPKSREHLARLGTSGQSDELPRLARRLASWKALYDNALAHAARHPLPDIPKQEVPAAAAAPAPPSPRPGTALSALWSDCPQTAGNSSAYSGSGSYSGGYSQYGSGQSDIPLLPPLPSPCAGVPLPRMALFDVVMIRTEESVGYGSGVNLLEGLKLTLGYSWNETRNSSDGGQASISQSIARTAGLPNGGITYSLNIFNVDTNHTEVIARPTLIALDRLGSTFFSGSNVSISISGEDVASLQDKSIGTALSITPTFIDDERMLLAIKVDRSYVEPVQLPGFNESLTTSKNSVTTNVMLRFGETVILSGLREREKNRVEDGVPVVNRIPIVQYLFNRTVQTEFNKHLVVLVTPRKPANFNGHTEKGDRYHEELKRINMRGETPASIASELAGITRTYQENLQQIVNALGVSTYYSEFRTGDVLPGDVSLSPHSLKRVFKDLRTLFYY